LSKPDLSKTCQYPVSSAGGFVRQFCENSAADLSVNLAGRN
jgi:hypothetical protein